MIVTFLLKGRPVAFLQRVKAFEIARAFDELEKRGNDPKAKLVSMQVGDGRGRANDEFLRFRKVGAVAKSMEFEDRDGYVLARFTF